MRINVDTSQLHFEKVDKTNNSKSILKVENHYPTGLDFAENMQDEEIKMYNNMTYNKSGTSNVRNNVPYSIAGEYVSNSVDSIKSILDSYKATFQYFSVESEMYNNYKKELSSSDLNEIDKDRISQKMEFLKDQMKTENDGLNDSGGLNEGTIIPRFIVSIIQLEEGRIKHYSSNDDKFDNLSQVCSENFKMVPSKKCSIETIANNAKKFLNIINKSEEELDVVNKKYGIR